MFAHALFRDVVCLALTLWMVPGSAGQACAGGNRGSAPRIVAVADGALANAIIVAAHGAVRRLEHANCQRVFDSFRDRAGRPLRERLAAEGWSPGDIAARVLFRDGRDAATCRAGNVAAFTGAGSRVVFICGRFSAVDRRRAELILVHEFLHTIGLDERPPAPEDIDTEVAAACQG